MALDIDTWVSKSCCKGMYKDETLNHNRRNNHKDKAVELGGLPQEEENETVHKRKCSTRRKHSTKPETSEHQRITEEPQ